MFKYTSRKIIVIILFLLSSLLLSAEQQYLSYGDIEFPISIDFPITPELNHMIHPLMLGATIYFYTAIDLDKRLAYHVVFTYIPESLGSISQSDAQFLVDNSLAT